MSAAVSRRAALGLIGGAAALAFLPAGGLVRLRLAATDTTRIYRVFLPDMEGRIIACDGHPLRVPVDVPTEAAPHALGPGQRVDFALRMPGSEGRAIAVMTSGPGGPRRLARLRARGRAPSRPSP